MRGEHWVGWGVLECDFAEVRRNEIEADLALAQAHLGSTIVEVH